MNTGSAALTVCAKETAPAPSAKTDAECAPAAQMPTGIIDLMSANVVFGAARAYAVEPHTMLPVHWLRS